MRQALSRIVGVAPSNGPVDHHVALLNFFRMDADGGGNGKAGKAAGKRSRGAAKVPSVAVLGKALAVLDALANAREATTSEVAEMLGEPRSSVYRLLNTLESLELVEPGNHRGTYRLGLKLFELGGAVLSRLDVRSAAIEPMRRLGEETGETVFLCLRRGREAVCIERIDGARATSMALKLGGSLPLHSGAAPVALLAAERRAEWDAYVQGGELKNFRTGETIPPEEVIAHLEETRRNGVAVSDEDVNTGFAALGVPIYDYRGDVPAAISVSGMRQIIFGKDEARIREGLLEVAGEISRNLGFESRMLGGLAGQSR
jgi:DNA-binding IclR family transcriptional regulator